MASESESTGEIKAQLSITTKEGDRITVYPGAGRRTSEAYDLILGFIAGIQPPAKQTAQP